MGLEGAKSGAFILRFFELITSIVAFATIVDYDSDSRVKYTMFTGITGFILAFFFMVFYVAGVRAARGAISFGLDVLWTIFWLAAAACMSNILVEADGGNSDLKASCAFSWISFFLWIGSTIVSFTDMRSGVAGPSPTAPPVIPSSSVGMV